MTKMQRTKGATFERWVVNQFKAAGFHAERTDAMQKGQNTGNWPDVLVSDIGEGYGLFVECKHHADLPAYLWKPDPFQNRAVPGYLLEWLDGNDAVIFKGNGKDRPAMAFYLLTYREKLNCTIRSSLFHGIKPLAVYIEGLR